MTTDTRIVLMGMTFMFYVLQWIAVNIAKDTRFYNLLFIFCGVMHIAIISTIK